MKNKRLLHYLWQWKKLLSRRCVSYQNVDKSADLVQFVEKVRKIKKKRLSR